jgi:hypothetical protein
MNLTVLSQIEARLDELSFAEQLWLLERLAQRLRAQMIVHSPLEQQLAAMAEDPDIQRELQRIEEEFAPAAADGLELS